MDKVNVGQGNTDPFDSDIPEKVFRSLQERNDPMCGEFREWLDLAKDNHCKLESK